MEMIANCLVLLISLFISTGTALECYICDSEIHGNACYDPIDKDIVKSQDCKTVYNRQASSMLQSATENFDNKQPQKYQSNYNPMFYPNPNPNPNLFPNNPTWNENPSDFECVQYEKVYSRTNRRQLVRKCEGRNQTPNLCAALAEIGNFQGFSLTRCGVCYSDYCNSGRKAALSTTSGALMFIVMSCKILELFYY